MLAIIDRIGEMIAAIEAGEEMPGGDDSALIDALAPGAEGARRSDRGCSRAKDTAGLRRRRAPSAFRSSCSTG